MKIESKAPVCWEAVYQTEGYSRSSQRVAKTGYHVKGTATKECPASLITPESLQLVQEIQALRHVQKSIGGQLNIERMDARFFDAIRTLEVEDIRTENARIEAERSIA